MRTTATPPWWIKLIGSLGLAGHLALSIWYLASGLLAPGWAVAMLLAVWVALLVAAIVLLRRRPLAVPLVPLVGLLIWLLVISAGEAWLGWTG
jgi:hypothetical protein